MWAPRARCWLREAGSPAPGEQLADKQTAALTVRGTGLRRRLRAVGPLRSVMHSPGPRWGNLGLRNTGQGQRRVLTLQLSQTLWARGTAHPSLGRGRTCAVLEGSAWEPAPPPLTTARRIHRLAPQHSLAGCMLALKEASHLTSGRNYRPCPRRSQGSGL